MARTKSPRYPNYQLSEAIINVQKIFEADRTTPIPREVIAKHLGYSGISGASDAKIATITQYGLLERTGKAESRVSQLAVDILLPENESQKQEAINRAALKPTLFADIWDNFDARVPSDEALRTYLLRRGFNDRAIDPIMKSFAPTIAMMKQQEDSESGGAEVENGEELTSPPTEDESDGASASVGDYVQWENQGVLQFNEPLCVRWVSDDKEWLAVEGSSTGIPMNEVTVEKTATKTPPVVPPIPVAEPSSNAVPGFTEWFRAKVGPDKLVTINYKGADDIGPREIEKMIAILEAQKLALED